MAKIKTDDLIDAALDYAVAIAEGATDFRFDTVATYWVTLHGKDRALRSGWAQSYQPSTDWSHGGPIIDRAGISPIRCDDDYGIDTKGFTTNEIIPVWCATIGQHSVVTSTDHQSHEAMYQVDVRDVFYGPTPLVAAMRCFVTSKLGAEVDVPDELLGK